MNAFVDALVKERLCWLELEIADREEEIASRKVSLRHAVQKQVTATNERDRLREYLRAALVEKADHQLKDLDASDRDEEVLQKAARIRAAVLRDVGE